MNVVRHIGARRIEVVEVPDPEPGPGEVVVALRASGICGSDLHPYRREPRGTGTNVLGHEASGVVTAVGEGVGTPEVGRRVTVYHYMSCGRCEVCRQGNWMWCGERRALGTHVRGAHADRVLADARNCFPLPEELSFIDGAFIACGAGTTWSALEKLAPSSRDTAVVFGLGPVGLVGVALLRAFGVAVAAVGRRASRVGLAREMGAEPVVDIDADDDPAATLKEAFPKGVKLGYETSGSPDAQRQMVASLARFGRAAVVGLGSHEPAVNLSGLAGSQKTVMGSFVMNAGSYDALAGFLVRHRVPLEKLVTHRYPIEQAREAYEMADTGDAAKVIFEWPEE